MRTICFAVVILSAVCVPAFSQESEDQAQAYVEAYQRIHARLLVCFAENAPLLDDGETSTTLIARALRRKCIPDIIGLCAMKYPMYVPEGADRLIFPPERDECQESDFVDDSLVAVLEARVRNQ